MSPFKFLNDIRGWPSLATKHGRLAQYADLFQLSALSQRADKKDWSCHESEKIWSTAYSNQPYQLWSANPKYGGQLIGLPTIDNFPCPKSGCGYCPSRPVDQWIKERFSPLQMKCICSSSLNVTDESLARDVAIFDASRDEEDAAKHLKGVCINSRTGSNQTSAATKLLRTVNLQSLVKQGAQKLGENCTTSGSGAILDASNDAKKLEEILKSMRIAYTATPWKQLSLCLVSAVQRQQSFLEKVTTCTSIRSQAGLDAASANYYRFMMLVKTKKERGLSDGSYLIPTIEIDFFWHTHQLMPWYYHAWCKENLGCRVNHDDTLAESVLSDNRSETVRLWKAEYQEPFDAPIVPKKRFSLFASRPAVQTGLITTAALASHAVVISNESRSSSPPSSPEPEYVSQYTGTANVVGASCGGCGGGG